eukprot:13169911-Ditylum_brightwellii.AAC.1
MFQCKNHYCWWNLAVNDAVADHLFVLALTSKTVMQLTTMTTTAEKIFDTRDTVHALHNKPEHEPQ